MMVMYASIRICTNENIDNIYDLKLNKYSVRALKINSMLKLNQANLRWVKISLYRADRILGSTYI